jgi:hypothetical protein
MENHSPVASWILIWYIVVSDGGADLAQYVPKTNSPTKLSVLLRGTDLPLARLSHAREGPRLLKGPVLYEGLQTRVRRVIVSETMQLNAHASIRRSRFLAVAKCRIITAQG